MTKKVETVEEFLARGGEITEIPFGESAETIRLQIDKKHGSRFKVIEGPKVGLNPWQGPEEQRHDQ